MPPPDRPAACCGGGPFLLQCATGKRKSEIIAPQKGLYGQKNIFKNFEKSAGQMTNHALY